MNNKIWPYAALITKINWDRREDRNVIVDWCNANLGPPPKYYTHDAADIWDIRTIPNGDEMAILVYTRQAEHHMLVTATWC